MWNKLYDPNYVGKHDWHAQNRRAQAISRNRPCRPSKGTVNPKKSGKAFRPTWDCSDCGDSRMPVGSPGFRTPVTEPPPGYDMIERDEACGMAEGCDFVVVAF